MKRKSQRGVALVITLIMLSIVLIMAVLFLGISRRELVPLLPGPESQRAFRHERISAGDQRGWAAHKADQLLFRRPGMDRHSGTSRYAPFGKQPIHRPLRVPGRAGGPNAGHKLYP